jgi:hypothetical protein
VTCLLYDDTAVTGASTLVVRAGAAQSMTAPLGSELVANGGFITDLSGWTISGTGTGWTWNAGTALHAAGNTETLSQNITVANGTTYQVEFTLSGITAGGVTVSIGAVTLVCYPWDISFSSNGTWQRTLVASGSGAQALTFTPTNAFDGALDNVTVKAITGSIPSLVQWVDNAGTVILEARGNQALRNTSMGLNALGRNTTGSNNSAQGVNALFSNTTGYYNSAQGVNALFSNTTGYYNSAQGLQALFSNTTGSNNSAQGVNALFSNTTGYYNSAQGLQALFSNTTGSNNSAQGVNALFSNTTGYYNSAQGVQALFSNTTGYYNSAQGVSALLYNTTGYYLSALGVNAGVYIADGASPNQTSNTSIYLGAQTKAFASGDSNEIVIGYNATGAGTNTATLGNTSISQTKLRGRVFVGSETAQDAALSRTSIGLIEVNSGTTGKWAGFQAGSVTLQSLTTPVGQTVTPTCGSGCTQTWGYKVAARDGSGKTTAVTGEFTTVLQNATLDATNYNTLTCTAVPGATTYAFYRTTSGGTPATLGLIGTAATCSLVDNGLVGDGSTPPILNYTGAVIVPTLTPAAASDPCDAGRMTWDASYVYVCTASGAWKRAAIATW